MKLKKKLKIVALASSLLLAFNLTSCTPKVYVNKHRLGDTCIKLKKPKHKYAILILGSDSNNDVLDRLLDQQAFQVYESLKELGFSDDDILFFVDPSSRKVLDKKVDYVFSGDMFKIGCSKLEITKDDLLFFSYIGHGGKIYEDHIILGSGSSVSFKVLKEELEKLDFLYSIMIFDTCYSGDMAVQLGKGNIISVSNTKEDKIPVIFSEFSPYLLEALKGEEEADRNEDNRVSLEEAVYYATEKDPWSVKNMFFFKNHLTQPQIYYEDIDPSQVFLKE